MAEPVTCVFSGGVGQAESTSSVVGPAHKLDSDLVASGIDQLFSLQSQTAVLRCYTAHAPTKKDEDDT